MRLQKGLMSGLRSISVPDSVTTIGNYAFSGCTKLQEFNCESVKSIGSYAFSGCNLTRTCFLLTINHQSTKKGNDIMKFNIHGKKLDVTESIKSYIEEKIGRLDKYFENPDEITSTVLIKLRGNDQVVEVTINANKFILRGEESHKDLYESKYTEI